MSAKIYSYNLPMPPSVNALWKTGNARMYRSKKYLEWIAECEGMLADRERPRIDYPFAIDIAVGRPSKRRMDIDNRVKAVMDILEREEIITDDCLCWHMTVYWDEEITGCKVMIRKAAMH